MSIQTGVLGIDFGSSGFIVALAKRGNVEILVNEANYRSTPSLVTYGAERAVGDSALNKVKKELRNSVHMPCRFLGDLSEQMIEKELFFNYAKVRPNGNSSVSFQVQNGGEALELFPEQVVGTLFTKVKQILSANQVGCSTLVVSVPSYYGPVERQALINSAKIAKMEISLLVNESSALLLSYGIFRKADLDTEKGRKVVFTDVGHSKTSIFVARVFRDSAEILHEKIERELGVRDLDRRMFEFYASKILEKSGQSITDFPKSKLRLIEAIEKQRKVLTSNNEATLNIDCLIGEEDFHYTINRDQYIEICAPVFDLFQQFFLLAKEEMNSFLADLHSIEKVGGGSRIPFIEKILSVSFGVESVGRTLDAGESIARGAAIRSAMISPLFKVSDFVIKDRLVFDLRARFQYESEKGTKEAVLFGRNCESGKILSVNLSKNEILRYEIFRLDSGQERGLISGEVERSNPRTERFEAKIFYSLDNNLFPRVDRAEIKETFPAEESLPESAEVKTETVEKKEKKEKIETRQLAFSANCQYGLSAEPLARFQEIEQGIIFQEQLRADLLHSKYAFEAFIYDTRADLQNDLLAQLSSAKEKESILTALEEGQNWLYGEGSTALKEHYKERLEHLKNFCRTFLSRKETALDLEHFIILISSQLQKLRDKHPLLEKARVELKESFETAISKIAFHIKELNTVRNEMTSKLLDTIDYPTLKQKINSFFEEGEKTIKQFEREKLEETRRAEEENRRKEEEARKREEEKKKMEESAKTKPNVPD